MEAIIIVPVLLAFGLPGALWPYKLSRLQEQFDSIGSRRSWSEVEPADWKVGLTRILGIGMSVIGAIGALSMIVG